MIISVSLSLDDNPALEVDDIEVVEGNSAVYVYKSTVKPSRRSPFTPRKAKEQICPL
jgi:hypothetical protein